MNAYRHNIYTSTFHCFVIFYTATNNYSWKIFSRSFDAALANTPSWLTRQLYINHTYERINSQGKSSVEEWNFGPQPWISFSKEKWVNCGHIRPACPSCLPACHHSTVGNVCKSFLKFANWFCSYTLHRCRKNKANTQRYTPNRSVEAKTCLTTQETSSSVYTKVLSTVDRQQVHNLQQVWKGCIYRIK